MNLKSEEGILLDASWAYSERVKWGKRERIPPTISIGPSSNTVAPYSLLVPKYTKEELKYLNQFHGSEDVWLNKSPYNRAGGQGRITEADRRQGRIMLRQSLGQTPQSKPMEQGDLDVTNRRIGKISSVYTRAEMRETEEEHGLGYMYLWKYGWLIYVDYRDKEIEFLKYRKNF